MSPKSNAHVWAFVGAVLAALIGAGAIIYINIKPPILPAKKHVNGIVADSRTKMPLAGVVVRLETVEGKLSNQDTTDRDGKFSLPIPENLSDLRVAVTFDGYGPYNRKLPAESIENNIYLERLNVEIAIPPGTPLESGMETVAAKLNVTVVFSSITCSKRAKAAGLDGATVEGDPNAPEVLVGAVLTHVKDTRTRYRVSTIEKGRRYEISCY